MTALDTIKSAILGVPLDPNKKPSRTGVVQAFSEMQSQLEAAQSGALVFSTLANLIATMSVPYANIMAWVVNDPTVANNGIYQNTGSAGAAVWTRRNSIPQFLITGMNTGTGTVNNIKITTDLPVPTQDGRALILAPILGANSLANPTISINGGAALPIVVNSGTGVVVNGLIANSFIVGVISNGKFVLLSDQASAAVAAAAANSAAAALAAVPNTYPATRAIMAAQPNTIIYSYLTEVGREGLFKRVTGGFSTASTRDVNQGITVPTTANPTTEAYVRVNPAHLTPGMFGVPVGATTGDYKQNWKDIINALADGYGNKKLIMDRDIVINGGYFIGSEFPNGVTIEGVNRCGFIEVSTAPTAQLLHFNNAVNNLTIRGVRFRNLNATTRAQANQAISTNDPCSNMLIENCEFSGFRETVWLNNMSYTTIRNNIIYNAKGDGIHLDGGSKFCKILDNIVQSTSDDMIALTSGVRSGNTARTQNIIISGNVLDNGAGTAGNGIAIYNVDDILISNNIMTNMKGNGVSIHTYAAGWGDLPAGLQPRCRRIKVEGNYIYNVGLAAADPDGVSYSTVKGHGHCVYLDGGLDIDIMNNTMELSNVSPNPYRAGLFMTSDTSGNGLDSIRIMDNTIKSIAGCGLRGFTTGVGYGCSNILVKGNYFEDILQHVINWTELYFSGKLTVRDNTAVLTDTQSNTRGMAFAAGTTSMLFDTSGNLIPAGHTVSLTGNAASWTRRNTTNTF